MLHAFSSFESDVAEDFADSIRKVEALTAPRNVVIVGVGATALVEIYVGSPPD